MRPRGFNASGVAELILAITYKPGLTPGVRVHRVSDEKWLDPATGEWGETIPDGVIAARPVPGAFAPGPNGAPAAASPYANQYIVDVPIEAPGAYLIFTHGPESGGFALADPVPQLVHIPESQAYQAYALSPVAYVPVSPSFPRV